jgi:hypothetical protein
MLDSPERVCAGQAWFEYPATFVLFSKATPHDNVVVHGGWESRSEAIV